MEPDFRCHLRVIAQAIQDMQLGIYCRLAKRYEAKNLCEDAESLAYCVVYDLFLNREGERLLRDFGARHPDLIAEQVREAALDTKISNLLSIAYAARLMELGYVTHSPMSPEAECILEKACALGIEITNIVSLWGKRTIINLHAVGLDSKHGK